MPRLCFFVLSFGVFVTFKNLLNFILVCFITGSLFFCVLTNFLHFLLMKTKQKFVDLLLKLKKQILTFLLLKSKDRNKKIVAYAVKILKI